MLKSLECLYYKYRLCKDHFERAHFMNDTCERLTYRALPTVFHDRMGGRNDFVNTPSESIENTFTNDDSLTEEHVVEDILGQSEPFPLQGVDKQEQLSELDRNRVSFTETLFGLYSLCK